MEEEETYKPIEWPLVRRLLSVLAPYKRQYLIGLALGLVHISCDMAGPKFMQHLIDFGTEFAKLTWSRGGKIVPYELPGAQSI